MSQRNLIQTVIQVVYSLVFGMIVAMLIWVGVIAVFESDFIPDNPWSLSNKKGYYWYLSPGMWMLICSTVILIAISFIHSARFPMITNGFFIGALMTMPLAVYAVLPEPETSISVMTAAGALVVTLGVGYWQFRVRKAAAPLTSDNESIPQGDPALWARLDKLEHRYNELQKALADR